MRMVGSMFGAFRGSMIANDARNQFTKTQKMTQTRKRNARRRTKVVMENAAIIREGRAALKAVNERIMNSARAGLLNAANPSEAVYPAELAQVGDDSSK